MLREAPNMPIWSTEGQESEIGVIWQHGITNIHELVIVEKLDKLWVSWILFIQLMLELDVC